MDAYSIFHTSSVSKIFTALAIMALVEDGDLNLEEKLTEIIPKLRYKDDRLIQVSIRQLLNHTSGIPDLLFYNWSKHHEGDTQLTEFVRDQNLKLKSTPGSSNRYSNLDYTILGYVVAKKSDTKPQRIFFTSDPYESIRFPILF